MINHIMVGVRGRWQGPSEENARERGPRRAPPACASLARLRASGIGVGGSISPSGALTIVESFAVSAYRGATGGVAKDSNLRTLTVSTRGARPVRARWRRASDGSIAAANAGPIE